MSTTARHVQPPHDLSEFSDNAEWGPAVAWPAPYQRTRHHVIDRLGHCLRGFSEFAEPRQRDAAVLALPAMLPGIYWFQQMALALQYGEHSNFGTGSENRGLNFLNGSSVDVEGIAMQASIKRTIRPAPSLAVLRRMRITSRWASIWKVPANILWPQVSVGSINELLFEMAAKESRRVDYIFPETIYDATKRSDLNADGLDAMQDLAGRLAAVFSDIDDLDSDFRSRLSHLIETVIVDTLIKAAIDNAAIKKVKRLPNEFWTGTGGGYLGRVIGMEVLHRGGKVVRFGHGGSAGTTDAIEAFVATELLVSSCFIAQSKEIGGLMTQSLDEAGLKNKPPTEIAWADGDPAIRDIQITPVRAGRGRPRVMYAPTLLCHEYQQYAPPLLPNPIYLDWQLRLAGVLEGLPIDFVCKPHPEGHFANRRNPLETVAPTSYEPFEAIWGETDILIFDWCQSTTFWKAVCSDRKVIVMDVGMTNFTPAVRPMIERRCEVLAVEFDERNRPLVPLEALTDAVSTAHHSNDPGEFLELFTGAEN
jgi:hypothetical protein